MNRWRRSLACLVCLFGLTDCTIAGSWKTVSVDPPGASVPVDSITFDKSHNYTASWQQAGKSRTTLGEYRWNGFRLNVVRPGNQPETYGARIGLDGKLTLTYGTGASKIKTVLERADQ